MNYPFNCEQLFNADNHGIAIIDSKFIKSSKCNENALSIIDTLGELSAKVIFSYSHKI